MTSPKSSDPVDRVRVMQWVIAALLGILGGQVAPTVMPGAEAAPVTEACVVDASWRATVDTHVKTADVTLSTMAKDVASIRETLAELRGAGVLNARGGP